MRGADAWHRAAGDGTTCLPHVAPSLVAECSEVSFLYGTFRSCKATCSSWFAQQLQQSFGEIVQTWASRLANEPEYHVALCELFAGSRRALGFRVELARTVYMLLRAAPMAGCGLEVAAEQLRGWLVEAGRLLPLLLAGNAAVTHAR